MKLFKTPHLITNLSAFLWVAGVMCGHYIMLILSIYVAVKWYSSDNRMNHLVRFGWLSNHPQRYILSALQWRHNQRDGVSNYRRRDGLSDCLFRRNQRKHQGSASQAFVRGIHRWPMNALHKGPGWLRKTCHDSADVARSSKAFPSGSSLGKKTQKTCTQMERIPDFF